MTRGRRPLKALIEAEQIALRRGAVQPAPGKRGDAFDLIIFEETRTVLVKVKRSATHFTNPLEVLHQYQRELARLHQVPLTLVTAREFWIRSPRGKWQFFLIRHDSVIEIQADGTYIHRAALPVIIPGPARENDSAGINGEFTSENNK